MLELAHVHSEGANETIPIFYFPEKRKPFWNIERKDFKFNTKVGSKVPTLGKKTELRRREKLRDKGSGDSAELYTARLIRSQFD